jgi:DNA-binding Xre family transcriptional regulator
MSVRLRIPELLKEHDCLTAYALSKRTNGRVSITAAYRILEAVGRLKHFEADLIDALCEAFDVSPGELFEREASRYPRAGRKVRAVTRRGQGA